MKWSKEQRDALARTIIELEHATIREFSPTKMLIVKDGCALCKAFLKRGCEGCPVDEAMLEYASVAPSCAVFVADVIGHVTESAAALPSKYAIVVESTVKDTPIPVGVCSEFLTKLISELRLLLMIGRMSIY